MAVIDNFYSLQLTQDHIHSQYFVSIDFSKVKKLDGILDKLGTSIFTFRQEGDFQVPAIKIPHNTYFYKGRSFNKRVPKDLSDKQIELSFRLDKYGILFKLLDKIFKYSYDYTKGNRTNKSDVSNFLKGLIKSDLEYRMDIKVYYTSYGEVINKNPFLFFTNYFYFEGCQIVNIALDGFNHNSGDPTKVKVTLVYDYFEPVLMERQKKKDSFTI